MQNNHINATLAVLSIILAVTRTFAAGNTHPPPRAQLPPPHPQTPHQPKTAAGARAAGTFGGSSASGAGFKRSIPEPVRRSEAPEQVQGEAAAIDDAYMDASLIQPVGLAVAESEFGETVAAVPADEEGGDMYVANLQVPQDAAAMVTVVSDNQQAGVSDSGTVEDAYYQPAAALPVGTVLESSAYDAAEAPAVQPVKSSVSSFTSSRVESSSGSSQVGRWFRELHPHADSH